ncbi:hypothetical protein ACVW0J_009456 [Bradyrhizobium sp. i1.7.7]
MIAIAFRRVMSKLVATLRVVGREPGVSDRGGQDKSRKVAAGRLWAKLHRFQ